MMEIVGLRAKQINDSNIKILVSRCIRYPSYHGVVFVRNVRDIYHVEKSLYTQCCTCVDTGGSWAIYRKHDSVNILFENKSKIHVAVFAEEYVRGQRYNFALVDDSLYGEELRTSRCTIACYLHSSTYPYSINTNEEEAPQALTDFLFSLIG